jgi:hypothetical protein
MEFEQDRRIAWKTVCPGPLGRFVGGRIWRYEFDGRWGHQGHRELGHLAGQAGLLPEDGQDGEPVRPKP